MGRYIVNGHVTISISTTVVASSVVAARRKALERGMQSLCHQCATGDPEEEWVTSGELDGEPVITDVVWVGERHNSPE